MWVDQIQKKYSIFFVPFSCLGLFYATLRKATDSRVYFAMLIVSVHFVISRQQISNLSFNTLTLTCS